MFSVKHVLNQSKLRFTRASRKQNVDKMKSYGFCRFLERVEFETCRRNQVKTLRISELIEFFELVKCYGVGLRFLKGCIPVRLEDNSFGLMHTGLNLPIFFLSLVYLLPKQVRKSFLRLALNKGCYCGICYLSELGYDTAFLRLLALSGMNNLSLEEFLEGLQSLRTSFIKNPSQNSNFKLIRNEVTEQTLTTQGASFKNLPEIKVSPIWAKLSRLLNTGNTVIKAPQTLPYQFESENPQDISTIFLFANLNRFLFSYKFLIPGLIVSVAFTLNKFSMLNFLKPVDQIVTDHFMLFLTMIISGLASNFYFLKLKKKILGSLNTTATCEVETSG
ncbi:MAG: hypothetical protein NZO16_06325, partial [Deltaproteobacteria bacterium]|nr:hypothetical protein [Deltaproteobacteria bacterium]